MNIVFLGSGAFALPALDALAGSRHRLVHILSQPDRPAGRDRGTGKKFAPTAVSEWALRHGAPLTRTDNANAPEVLALIRAAGAGCLVVIAFGQKLSDELLALTPHRPINLHSSLLPKYRGAAPINWAVIQNEPTAGVSVIEVTSVMDAGDILSQSATPVGETETAGELHDRLALLGAPLLPEVLDAMASGVVRRRSQDSAATTRAPKLSRELAWIDFSQAAPVVSARIRGMSPWPGIQVHLVDRAGTARSTLTLLKCRAVPSGPHAPAMCGAILPDQTIACGTGAVQILMLQPPGKKAMDLAAFINGHPEFTGGARLAPVVPPPSGSVAR